MKKLSRQSKIFLYLAMIVTLVAAAVIIVRVNDSRKCQDIIGDGYAMGTDPQPVVIGNTCDS